MLKNRLCYVGLLFCTAAFLVCFDGYLSYYIFLLSLAVPFLSLIISLPGMLLVRLSLFVNKEGTARAQKGDTLPLRITVATQWPFPAGRVKVRLNAFNSLTGESNRELLTFIPDTEPQVLEQPLSSPLCGLVTCTFEKARACDLLGLFALPMGKRGKGLCRAFFYPKAYHPGLTLSDINAPVGESERYSAIKPGDDPSELFGLREYREGDKISRIHWKLSQKSDKTLVKEPGLPLSEGLFFLLDCNGGKETADALLDVFFTFSSFLSAEEVFHRVAYRDGETGLLQIVEITGPQDALPALEAVLSLGGNAPLPSLEKQILPVGISHGVYLCAAPDAAVLTSLRAAWPGETITLIMVTEDSGAKHEHRKAADAAGADFLPLHPQHIEEDLEGFTL